MIESKQFAGGGMNQDVQENYLKPNEWQHGRNIRVTDKLDGSEGVISNVKGNTEIEYTLPSGSNKCIGSYANEQTGKYYSFIWNSLGNHLVTEYNAINGDIELVITGSFLNFQQYELINGVSIIDGKYLYWTGGYNPPRSIDIEAAKADPSYYDSSISISLAKQPPLKLITAEYANDPDNDNLSINRLKGQLFQFRYLYVYNDNSRSAWSSMSEVPYPTLEVNQSIASEAFRNNNILLTFDVGSKFVKTVEIAAIVKGVGTQGTTQDWFTILSKDRADLISDPKFSFDSSTNTCNYRFFNDGLYQSVDVIETDLQYDYVPLVSKCLDIINGNVLVLANNTEGYDNIDIDVDFSVDYAENSGINRLAVSEVDDTTVFTFSGTPVVGDQINYDIFWYFPGGGPPDPPPGHEIGTLTLTSAQSGNLLLAVYYLIGTLADLTSDNVIGTATQNPDGTVTLTFENSPGLVSSGNMGVTLASSSLVASQSTYKTNSKYQFGLVYYDEFNRSTYVQTKDECIVSTSAWGAASGQSPKIIWGINHSAPTWATSYQWVRTEQLTHSNFLFWVSTSANAPVGKDYYELDFSSLTSYNEKNPNSILTYDYTPGDRCTIHKIDSTWQSGMDVSVVGASGSIIQIDNGVTIPTGSHDILVEIYTPKTRSNQPTEQFFYEFGELYSCSGGVHSSPTGFFQEGDIFVRQRVQTPTITVTIEDPNFSDFYKSNYSSNGRTNIFAPQAKQLNLPTDVRYSDTYVPNTNINGLSRFYGNAYETYDRVNGSIQKLSVRDNYLFTFQELKTGFIPIAQSIIEDQAVGDPNVAISTKLLNKIRYLVGDYGIGKHPESFAKFAGTMYFTDPNRGQVLKITSGIQPIGILGMDKYFTKKLSQFNNITNAKINGSYDPYNDEYIISFKETSGSTENDETVSFSESINRWTTFYDFKPDSAGYIFNKYITNWLGRMWEHNTNDSYNTFYGTTWISEITVVFNSSPAVVKTFLGLMEQSSTKWAAGNISTSEGQTSELSISDFSFKEGVYMASLLRDSGSPGGLINGDALKGNWIKFELSEGEATKQIIQSLHLRVIPSYQGIK